jgi:hypothetical protein
VVRIKRMVRRIARVGKRVGMVWRKGKGEGSGDQIGRG